MPLRESLHSFEWVGGGVSLNADSTVVTIEPPMAKCSNWKPPSCHSKPLQPRHVPVKADDAPTFRAELALNRTRALGLVTKARALVGEEAAKSAKLPKNAEAIVFGYFDTLASFRSTVKNDDQEPPPPAAPAPATPSGG